MTQDDFITQILAAEEQAAAEVDKARKNSQNESAQYEVKLVKQRETALEKLRDQSKAQLKERQQEERKKYESAIADGLREAATLEKEVESKMDKHLGTAQAYFVNELL